MRLQGALASAQGEAARVREMPPPPQSAFGSGPSGSGGGFAMRSSFAASAGTGTGSGYDDPYAQQPAPPSHAARPPLPLSSMPPSSAMSQASARSTGGYESARGGYGAGSVIGGMYDSYDASASGAASGRDDGPYRRRRSIGGPSDAASGFSSGYGTSSTTTSVPQAGPEPQDASAIAARHRSGGAMGALLSGDTASSSIGRQSVSGGRGIERRGATQSSLTFGDYTGTGGAQAASIPQPSPPLSSRSSGDLSLH